MVTGEYPMDMQSDQTETPRGAFGTDFFSKIFQGQPAQKKPARADGQPAKRRGPKPDSKPALTRRQELNRQAQRTHRERKEQYMRSLETEVSRLREAYTNEISDANNTIQQQKEMIQSVADENELLKEILKSHGIKFEAELAQRRAERPPAAFRSSPIDGSTTGSHSAMLTNGTSIHHATPPTTISGMSPRMHAGVECSEVSPPLSFAPQHVYGHGAGEQLSHLDLSASHIVDQPVPAMVRGVFENEPQLQIDFILKLESPCREHTDYLCRRSVTEADDEDMPFSGHALMASCPPPSYISNTTPDQTYPHKTYDLPHANLHTLLNLSRQLVTEGQITPIMALQCLKNHELYPTLSRDDIKIVVDTLNTKVRCYGFGAVVEDFELMDCLSSVLGTKVELGAPRMRDDSIYS
ncbi:hypothetical protein N7468_006029 [Penicillium chermesinum]|uniref:BZIP-type transcription factor n=1 Tax=Penicillium chermesinum TaxID=63820 RepID=A0A9W9P0D9_9EURO|nr:uncharacterized protein N7468_006029 [Penicillium chermesinum]KAJ5233073.1 hypothetical protein N7468_006029 [Penicillium chermesinum]KAJ6172711.1 hypothetical protein N7470_001778 [Penicillium chermesinum]